MVTPNRNNLKDIIIAILLILCVILIIITPYSYLNNKEEPLQIVPYGWVLLTTTILLLWTSFIDNNIFTRSIHHRFYSLKPYAVILGLFLIPTLFGESYRDNFFLFLSIVVYLYCGVMSATYGGTIPYIKIKGLIFVTVFLFSILVWIAESFSSYYNGVEIGALQAATLYQNSVKQIILNEHDEAKLKEKIINYSKNTGSFSKIVAKIEKNGQEFLVPILREREGYTLSKMNTNFGKFQDGFGNHFEISYQFYNRPIIWQGLLKSIFFSVRDTSNANYFKRELYLRSLNLWWIFWLLYACAMYGFSLIQRQKEAINEKEDAYRKQKEAHAELEDYKIFFDDIRTHIDDQISENRNSLQLVDSSWSKIAQEANKAVLEGYINKRHDTFNYLIGKLKTWGKEDYLKEFDTPEYKQKLEDYIEDVQTIDQTYYKEKGKGQSILSETYNVVLNPWLVRIRKDLQNLDDIFDLTPTNVSVDKIVQGITSEKTIKKVKCNIEISNDLNKEAECCIIPDKLQSMVYNLLENSSQAGDRYYEELRKKDRTLARGFKTSINLKLKETEYNSKKYLSIEVQDNCGGFPPEFESIIYVDKVKSSKATNIDHGNGTYLIGRFAKRMGIIIQHETIKLKDNQKGAQTILLIPYV